LLRNDPYTNFSQHSHNKLTWQEYFIIFFFFGSCG